MQMKYRLVLQWPTRWSWSFSRLISVGEKLEGELGNLGVVDGHGMGSEMSIFVDTDDPKTAFERALVIHGWWKRRNLKAGYRDFEEEEYTPIYTRVLDRFSVI
jgi:hypothetical protein